MTRGPFITFEGGEGAGKSTQVRRLVDRLGAEGFEAIATREPGGTPVAEAFRAALLSGAVAPLGPAAEALVFSAARVDHLDRKIVPALERGWAVVCDRFLDSTRAYQGTLVHLDAHFLSGLERVVVGSAMPDLTLILDLPSAVGLERAARRRAPGEAVDRFEGEETAFHDRLRQAFLDIAAAEPRRCRVIDATQSPDAVAEAVWAAVAPLLRKA